MDNRRIGFFDSGLGGLTIIPHLLKMLPKEGVLYYGDTARTPYGSKDESTIIKFAGEVVEYLISCDVKIIVIACNTVSAIAVDSLRERFKDIPIIEIITPTARRIADTLNFNDNIGIIGTRGTINSKVYHKKIKARNPSLNIFETPCPAFVPLIEEGIIDSEIMELTVKHYLDDFINKNNINQLILGCTHYPFLRKHFLKLYPNLNIHNPSEIIIPRLIEVLDEYDMFSDDVKHDNKFYASDLSENYVKMVLNITKGTNLKNTIEIAPNIK